MEQLPADARAAPSASEPNDTVMDIYMRRRNARRGVRGGGGVEGDRGARGVRVLEGGSPQVNASTPTPLFQPRCRPLH
eukprot:scaffold6364_cov112-Isochrysis_galbana.AAC.1